MSINLNAKNETIPDTLIMDNGTMAAPVKVKGDCSIPIPFSDQQLDGYKVENKINHSTQCVPKSWLFSKEEAMARARQILTKN